MSANNARQTAGRARVATAIAPAALADPARGCKL